jgi:hypothetical protein
LQAPDRQRVRLVALFRRRHYQSELRVYEIAGAGRLQRRWFCAACGTTLFWKVSWRPDETGVAGFEPALAAPSVTVSNDGRCAWLGLPGEGRTSL